MKICVTRNLDLCPPDTIEFPDRPLYPHEIRAQLGLYLAEDDARVEGGQPELTIATLDRTVLDCVRGGEDDRLCWSNVWIETARGLVPLLRLHNEDWLLQTRLGRIFVERSALWLAETAVEPSDG